MTTWRSMRTASMTGRRPRAAGPWMWAAILFLALALAGSALAAQDADSSPPTETIKLVFVHHSSGENWLADDNGGLGRALGANNYYVSDTNYGWGPDAIGDRTDIPNWPEWFTEANSPRILAALYAETGQNSSYTRALSDPGGENLIILFKSCFPNSNLEGSPADPPRRGEGLTVGNAKAIYNELLTYFATRPDKLFVVISAPPVQDPSLAANARAFNTWLVQDWLAGYAGNNVAVFDFYNVLTGRDNHHWVRDGQIVYVTDRGRDTSAYASDPGDDHPSSQGNLKATEEFVPLLNAFVHRWLADKGAAPTAAPQQTEVPAAPTDVSQATEEPAAPTAEAGNPNAPPATGVLIDLEGGGPEWLAYHDEDADSTITCGPDTTAAYQGSASLRVDYDVAPGGWASCSAEFPGIQDWRSARGLALRIHTPQADQPVIVMVMQEAGDDWLHFDYRTRATQAAVDGWQRVEIPWEALVLPEWEGESTTRLDPARVTGLGLLFDGLDSRNTGTVWADELALLPMEPAAGAAPEVPLPAPTSVGEAPIEPTALPAAEETGQVSRRGLCPGVVIVGIVACGAAGWRSRVAGHSML